MARHKDVNWNLGASLPVDRSEATLAVLMDIRDELQRINRTLDCPNTVEIPSILRQIRQNTTRKRRKARRKR